MAKRKAAKRKATAPALDAAAQRALKQNVGNIINILPYVLIALQMAQAIAAAEGEAQITIAIDGMAAASIQAIEAGAGKDILNDALVLNANKQITEGYFALKAAIADAKARRAGV